MPIVTDVLRHIPNRLKGALIAIVVLALSAGLAFGAEPPSAASWGLANAASHAGKTVPVAGGEEGDEEGTDEEGVEEEEVVEEGLEEEGLEEEGTEEAGDNCATDPTALTPEELAEMKHGSVVCWAAHQTEWPEWFSGHGPFVKCWAHTGKADATSCTEDPTAEEPVLEEPTADDLSLSGRGNGNGKGKGKGHNKP